QLRVDRIDLSQAGIQRGCLSRAGRAGDNKNAIWVLCDLETVITDAIGHPKILELEVGARSVQHPQHYTFAERCRKSRDTEIDRVAIDDPQDAAILGQTALGNIQVRYDLDARYDGKGEVAGRRIHLIEGAVHPVADFEFGLKGLKMDVACAGRDGLIQDKINEANDGSRVGFLRS